MPAGETCNCHRRRVRLLIPNTRVYIRDESYSRKNLRKQTLVMIYDFGNFRKNIAYNVCNVRVKSGCANQSRVIACDVQGLSK